MDNVSDSNRARLIIYSVDTDYATCLSPIQAADSTFNMILRVTFLRSIYTVIVYEMPDPDSGDAFNKLAIHWTDFIWFACSTILWSLRTHSIPVVRQ